MTLPRTGATPGRIALAAEARRLRDWGLNQTEIGERLCCSRQYVSELIRDPDGSKARVRKDRYCGICVDCGGPTSGGEGRGSRAPKRCDSCSREHQTVDHPHGTRGRYGKGCSCASCRAANRAQNLALRGKKPRTHGVSGYKNYGCRCKVCRKAHSNYLFLHANDLYARRKRVAAKRAAA